MYVGREAYTKPGSFYIIQFSSFLKTRNKNTSEIRLELDYEHFWPN